MNDIILKLQQLGFSSYEAKAYHALVLKHPAHGYEISKIARVPPAKIYETLARLKNKGAIIDSSTDPAKYYPVPPETLLGRLKQDVLTTIEGLETQLQQVQPLPDIDLTWNLGDYQTIIDKMLAVIDNGGESLFLSIWPLEAGLLNDAVVRAENRGVTVVAGIFGTCDVRWRTRINLESCGVSSQKRLGNRLTVVIGDNKEVVISEIDPAGEAVGILTSTPCIVLVAKEYIKHDIWGKYLVEALGQKQFEEMCRTNEILSYLINNR